MIKKVLIGFVLLLAVLAGVIATRPAEFSLERSTVIKASPEVVYAQVVGFKPWSGWSPWDKIDADLQRTYSGPETGVGAHYEWNGKKTGKGAMTVSEATANSHLTIDLEFIEPFAAKNRVDFNFVPSPEGTKVTWLMSGHNDFMGKAMSLVMDMDKMVGPDFEKGLASLKTVSETAAAAAAAVPAPEPVAAPTEAAVDAGTP